MPYYGSTGWAYELFDADRDTGIQVEESADDDVIRFDLGGATPIGDAATFDQINGFYFNTGQDDLNFRWDGTSNTHLIFGDAGNNAVGFNTDDPTFIRNGTSKNSVFGVVKDDLAASQNGFFALASNTAARSADVSFLKCAGTWASKGALSNNDVIANLGAEGFDGTDFIRPAMIRWAVDGTVSTNVMPVETIILSSDSDGGGVARVRVRSNGAVNFGGGRTSPEAVIDSVTGAATFNEQGNDADFRVETSGSTHALFVDGGDNGVGIASSTLAYTRGGGSVLSRIFVDKEDAGNRNAGTFHLSSNTTSRAPDFSFAKRTIAGGALSSGETIGYFRADGWDGSDYETSSYIQFMVDASASAGDVPGRIGFVTYDGGVAKTRMIIESDDEVTIGTSRNNGAHFTVDAQSDVVQMKVLGDALQTNDYFQMIDSASAVDIRFTADGGAVFNEQGNNADFRIEGDTEAYNFFLDASNDAIAMLTDETTVDTAFAGTVIPTLTMKRKDAGNAINQLLLSDSDTATRGAFNVFARARGAGVGSFQAVQNGDRVGVFQAYAHDGTNFVIGGAIQFVIANTVSTGITPTAIAFRTMDSVGSTINRMYIDPDGNVGINTSSPSFLLDVDGDVRINSSLADKDFLVWGTVAAAIWHDAGNQRIRFGQFAASGDILELWTTKTEFNRSNNDVNFIVATSGESNTIYADGGTDFVGIHTGTPNSTFNANGSFALPYVAKTTTYTITADDHTIDCTGTFTVTLPTASGIAGRIYNIKNSGSGTITLDGNGSETIDGSLTAAIPPTICLTVQSTGSNWIII